MPLAMQRAVAAPAKSPAFGAPAKTEADAVGASATPPGTAPPGAAADAAGAGAEYSFREPAEPLQWREHFSSLLLMSGSELNTAVELALLLGITAVACCAPPSVVDVPGSMRLIEVAGLLWATAAVNRIYTAYLESVYFCCPQYRTQPPRKHALKRAKDLMGRERAQLEVLNWHDRVTLLSQCALNVGLYYALPGFYPARAAAPQSAVERVLRLLLNHYVLSFGMYWMHRAYHVNEFLWKHVHSIHHWANHPLSRNTYQDHWLDNFGGAVFGHVFAQILVPLDRETFWASHLFRVFESLEKHSGVSCGWNLVHTAQSWLPFAQMPHHHDWHHEGHKTCNYTFTAIGGLWDCVFGTRRAGRAASETAAKAVATADDRANKSARGTPSRGLWDGPMVGLPLAALTGLVTLQLRAGSGLV